MEGPIVYIGVYSKYRTWTRIRLDQVSGVLGARVPTTQYPGLYKTHAPPLGPPSHGRPLSYDTIVNRSKSLTYTVQRKRFRFPPSGARRSRSQRGAFLDGDHAS